MDELAAPPSPPEAATDSGPQIDDATLKSAMKAFRRRLKLTKLDDESQLTVRPLTGGKASEISSIIPPDQFPPEVWIELARQGKLRATGKGFYELTES
ncbi:MAG: hypothetical protein GC162_06545 [Planctomycetes bacterium]|nr:hypothetical protein [Planctomycetota bacterium]